MNSLHDEHCGTLQKFPHCRNLPEHFKLTPRTLRNPSKPQIPLQNLAPEWNPRTFQSQNITAIRTFRNFLRPRSSKSFSKSCICHAKTFQWYPPRKQASTQTLQPNVRRPKPTAFLPNGATPALWRSMLRRLYQALDGSSSQAYPALALCFNATEVETEPIQFIQFILSCRSSSFIPILPFFVKMSVVNNECILEDIHMNTRTKYIHILALRL